MPALRSLLLSQFRSHAATRLSFDGQPVAIFGPNGAGKTNILEAISLLSPGRGLRRAAPEDLARHPGELGWKVAATIDTASGPREVETLAAPGSAREVRIDGKASTQVALGRVLRMLWLAPAMDRIWIEGAEGRRRLLDRIALSFDPGHADLALAYDKALRERNRLLRDMVADTAWYLALEARMAETAVGVIAARQAALDRIAAAGGDTAFPAADLRVVWPGEGPDPSDLGASGIRQALAEGRRRDMAAGRTLVGPHRADLAAVWAAKGVPAAQCSTGEQKALLISLVLANARALRTDTGAAPLLLLDEVAAHLDADRRGALYAEILALGAQAFLTGTGADLFVELAGKAEFLEVAEAGGESSVRRRDGAEGPA